MIAHSSKWQQALDLLRTEGLLRPADLQRKGLPPPIPKTRAEAHTSRFMLSWLGVVIPSMSLEIDLRWWR